MTTEEAVEIRDRAVRLGLKNCCDHCREDIGILDGLLGGRPGSFAIVPPSQNAIAMNERKPAVLGTRMEDAARRLRRSIGRGDAA
jgi:hypothetical protein